MLKWLHFSSVALRAHNTKLVDSYAWHKFDIIMISATSITLYSTTRHCCGVHQLESADPLLLIETIGMEAL